MSVKVSVIVPAYQPGAGIDRVIDSLDRQSMPADEFEVIIIDDGSPDDTFLRLQRIRDVHTNITVSSIENSGWPSRPRNVGIGMARGEYVLFMDHDDYLYPDALRRSYEYATQNNADVLSPKESKTTDVGWALAESRKNIPDAGALVGINALMPMVPHKFYRRQFLNEHGIRFPEGRRMLWEDIYFNVEAYRHASVISVLSDTPVYRWVSTGDNNSSSYGPKDEEFWFKLISLLDFIVATLPDPDFTVARQFMMLHQFKKRVLTRFLSQLGKDPATDDENGVPMALVHINRILDEYVPESLDLKLGRILRPQAALLRRRQIELMRELKAATAGLAGVTHTDDVSWEDGKLVITATTRWSIQGGAPLVLREEDDRIIRPLSAALTEALAPELLDLTDEVRRAKTEITIRSRDGFVTWLLPTRSEVSLERHEDSRVEVTVLARAVLDIDHAIFGRALEDPIWDFHARNMLAGQGTHRALKADVVAQTAMVNGRSAVAYRSKSGNLALDLAQVYRSVISDGAAAAGRAASNRTANGLVEFTLPFNGVAVMGTSKIAGTLELRPSGLMTRVVFNHRLLRIPVIGARLKRSTALVTGVKPALLVADENGVRLESSFRAVLGTYLLVCRFEGRTSTAAVRLRVSLTGRPVFFRP